jgi:hypothetical protein
MRIVYSVLAAYKRLPAPHAEPMPVTVMGDFSESKTFPRHLDRNPKMNTIITMIQLVQYIEMTL